MKKNKTLNAPLKKNPTKTSDEKANDAKEIKNVDSLDDENQGFGGWLKSDDGLETMKLFVIANTIVLMTTLVLPHLKTAIEIAGEMVYGVEESFD